MSEISVEEINGRMQYLFNRLNQEIQNQAILAGQLNEAHARIAEYEKQENEAAVQ